MDVESFWTLIEDSRAHAPGHAARGTYLRERLIDLPPAEIVDFQALVTTMLVRADRWDLWASAARILGGFCSDDGFEYFRLWLIGCGRTVYTQAVAWPDSLADAPEVRSLVGRPSSAWDDEYPNWESLAYIAEEAYAELFGEDAADDFEDAVNGALPPEPMPDYLAEKQWSARDEEAATARIPKLAKAFPLS
ncbi:MAG TPA: DUF4240 domain-containing protein [Actinospica sp.]|nr:DUF4240 domain-containing protein [Actinospica sp.]